MPTLDERVAYLEGRVGEQSRTVDGVRDAVIQLDHRVHAFEERVDRRFETVDRRFEAVDRRFEGLERRLDGLDEKMTRYFVWVVGMQVTTLAAVLGGIGALVGR